MDSALESGQSWISRRQRILASLRSQGLEIPAELLRLPADADKNTIRQLHDDSGPQQCNQKVK
jgi:hypothetical protein